MAEDEDDKCSTAVGCCCCLYIFLGPYVLFVIICGSLYGAHPPEYDMNVTVSSGDSVLVQYDQQHDYDSLVRQSIDFFSDASASSPNYGFNIYQHSCKDVNSDTNTYLERNTTIKQDIECIDRCEINTYIYFVNKEGSSLTYNVTNIDDDGHSAVRFVLFENYYRYSLFISGENETPDQEATVFLSGNPVVNFDLSNMDAPSYVHIGLEVLGSSNGSFLTFIFHSQRSIYKVSQFDNVCFLVPNSSSTCKQSVFQNSQRQCFVLHISDGGRLMVTNVTAQVTSSESIILVGIFFGGLLIPCGCFCLVCLIVVCGVCITVCCYDNDSRFKSENSSDTNRSNSNQVTSSQTASQKECESQAIARTNDTETLIPMMGLGSEEQAEPETQAASYFESTEVDEVIPTAPTWPSKQFINCGMKPGSTTEKPVQEYHQAIPEGAGTFHVSYSSVPTEPVTEQSVHISIPHADNTVNENIKPQSPLEYSPEPPIPLSIEATEQTHRNFSSYAVQESIAKENLQRTVGTRDIQLSASLSDLLTTVFGASEQQLKTFEESLIASDTRVKSFSKPINIQYESISFNEKGLFHHSHDYGITITIPPGAVQRPAILQFGATLLLKDFKYDGPYLHPVSPFVWIHTDQVLCKPAELHIPHDVIADTIDDVMGIHLVTRADGSSTFKVNEQIMMSVGTNLTRLFSTHFCSLCLMANPIPKKRYHLVCAKKEFDDGTVQCDICVLYTFKCLKTFESAREGYEITKTAIPFAFEELKLISELHDDSGWLLAFRGIKFHSIKESHVDFYNFLNTTPDTVCVDDIEALKYYEEEGSYPPCFKLLFSPHPTIRPKSCQVKISLVSKTEDILSVEIELKGETVWSPLSQVSTDSAYDSYKANDLNESFFKGLDKINDKERDEFLINTISFLESKITTDWVQFGYRLGLPLACIYNIEIDVGHDKKRCIRQMLLYWNKVSQDVSTKVIVEALQASGYHLLSAILTNRFRNGTFCSMCQTTHGTELHSTDAMLGHLLGSLNSPQEPSMDELSNLIVARVPAKWELFGVQLGVPQYTIDAIKKDNPGDCKMCFVHLLEEWRKTRSKPYTWATVIKVLYSPTFEEFLLAEKIYYDFFIK